MKKKTPQKSQLWRVGTKLFRIVRFEDNMAVVRHHDEWGKFFIDELKPATKEQVLAYLGK